MNKKILIGISILVIVVVVASSFLIFKQEKETVKIGAIFSITGAASSIGEPLRDGALLAVEEVNAKGGINGRKIELIIEDSETNPEKAKEVFLEMEEKRQPLLYLSALSSVSTAVSSLAEESEVVLIPLLASDPKITLQKEWTFRYYPIADDQVPPILFILQELKVKDLGILYLDDEFGRSIFELLKKQFEKRGGTVRSESFQGNEFDYSEQIAKLNDVEAFFAVGFPEHLVEILKQLREKDYQGYILASLTASTASVSNMSEANRIYLASTIIYDPDFLFASPVKEKFEARYNKPFDYIAANGYDTVKILEVLLEDEELSRENVKRVFDKGFIYSGVFGNIEAAPGEHDIAFPLYPAQIVNVEVVYGKQASLVPPQYIGVQLDEENPIKVGVLHSLSGTMAVSETSVVDATLLAIEEINDRGGILGRKVEPIVVDGKSDWPTFAEEAERLIVDEKVSTIFGGWTSASRKTMKPVFEKYDHLLFYPVQYEGLEQSPNIVYTGAAPNQQVLPAIDWAFENLGTKFFLVGSDYVFPRSANAISKERIKELGGQILGEEYRILGDRNFTEIVEKIIESQPDVILNTINGNSNISFFQELRKRGIYPENIPIISFSIAEDEIRKFGAEDMKGDYAAWNYFQSLDTLENKVFVANFKKKYGSDRVTDDPMQAGYIGPYLFAKAVEKAGKNDVNAIREAVKGMTFSAPEGIVGVDPETQHVWKTVRIGRILEDGQFEIVYSTEVPIEPVPYPKYKSEEEWHTFLQELYNGWGRSWSNRG